jgi:hypothetical protein
MTATISTASMQHWTGTPRLMRAEETTPVEEKTFYPFTSAGLGIHSNNGPDIF